MRQALDVGQRHKGQLGYDSTVKTKENATKGKTLQIGTTTSWLLVKILKSKDCYINLHGVEHAHQGCEAEANSKH